MGAQLLGASMWVREQYPNIIIPLNPLLRENKLFTREACHPFLKIITNSSNRTTRDTGDADFLLRFSE